MAAAFDTFVGRSLGVAAAGLSGISATRSLSVKYQIEIWRGDDLAEYTKAASEEKAYQAVDKMIQRAHAGLRGIGTFKISIYELAHEGHVERCVREFDAFRVPVQRQETP